MSKRKSPLGADFLFEPIDERPFPTLGSEIPDEVVNGKTSEDLFEDIFGTPKHYKDVTFAKTRTVKKMRKDLDL